MEETEIVTVAFIIPHMGREEMLIQTLASITALDPSEHAIEVHVATKNQSLSLPDSLKVLDLHVHHRPMSETISHQRNFGASQTQAEYLAFLDADIELSHNWLKAMLALLAEDANRVLVSAKQICGPTPPPLERIRTALSNAALDCPVQFLPGRNLFLKRDVFDKVGGFPEHLITCEDYYFTDQIGQHGALYYSSKAEYVHLGEDKYFSEMYKKEIWRGQSNLQSINGRHVPLSELPSFLVPVWILVFALATLVSLCRLALLNAHIVELGVSLALLLFPILLYSFRLYRIAKPNVRFAQVLKFYAYYFPARIVGTFRGLFSALDSAGKPNTVHQNNQKSDAHQNSTANVKSPKRKQ